MNYTADMEAEQKRYVNILFDEATLAAIDDWRFKNRIPSRTEAIRQLVAAALKRKDR